MMPTIAELRTQIDTLDQQIIVLLAERARIVYQIGDLKTSEEEVVAKDRQQEVYATRRQWAEQHGLDPDLVEVLYRALIAYFIEREKEQLAGRR
jgi:isochorismate pyruvate lyase